MKHANFLKKTEFVSIKILKNEFPDLAIKWCVLVKIKSDEKIVLAAQLDTSFGQMPLMEIGFKEVHEILGYFPDEEDGSTLIISFAHLNLGSRIWGFVTP